MRCPRTVDVVERGMRPYPGVAPPSHDSPTKVTPMVEPTHLAIGSQIIPTTQRPRVFCRTSHRSLMATSLAFLVALASLPGPTSPAFDDPPAASDQVDFAKQVLPVLSAKCFLCHGPDAAAVSDLRLDLPEQATADRGGYRAVNPDEPAASSVLLRIHSADDPMPPVDAEAQLTDAERELLTKWIQQGGQYAQHWAFVPPQSTPPRSAPAAVGSAAIDAYIFDALKAREISPAPRAEKWVLARRVALTLTGLPPQPAVLEAYLNDDSPAAYERLVDTLLASPAFGEHQARYWLDAIRYGDTHGLHLDNRRGIFPYRDWVIKAFNQNLPWDQFITWQLAGDLLPQPTLEQQVATGFVRMNPTTAEGGAIPEEFQAKNSFDRTETFGTVFLGLSLTCARCHTHKYDPITHDDYFRLLAYFNSTAEHSMDGNKYDYEPVIKAPADLPQWEKWQQWQQQAQAWCDSLSQPAALAEADLPAAADPDTRAWWQQWSQQDLGGRLQLAVTDTINNPLDEAARQTANEHLLARQNLEQTWSTTLIAKELDTPRPTHVLHRGEYDQPIGEPLTPQPLAALGTDWGQLPPNRLGLAQWILHPKHPLTTRVLVNRFWSQVFGAPLVRTPEEFGLQGDQPTHPELLDYLAIDFRTHGWDMKRMLKQLVMSQTFQQSSAWRPELDDAANRLWARGPGHRLDAEVIRDLALVASGRLIDATGGEGFKPYQPPGMWEALAHPGSNTRVYQEDDLPNVFRRSLYLYWKRTSPHPMMTLFDAPSRESSCVQRSRSNTPVQSLGLLNEPQRVQLALATAHRLHHLQTDDNGRLRDLYQSLTSRLPSELEQTVCLQLLADFRQRFEQFPADARSLYEAHGTKLLPELDPAELNDTVAWSQVVMTVLASDAVIMLY